MIELPKDAEGREIPLDTEVLYDSCGTKVSVKEFLFRTLVESQKTEWTIKAQYEGNMYYNSFKPKDMRITQVVKCEAYKRRCGAEVDDR